MTELTIGMTPAFLYPGDMLLAAQLRCLSEQEARDFNVLLVDAHYQKRKGYIPELAERYKLNITHVPYVPNLHVAKRLDCAVFNAPYCYSESPKIVRYSCWRFARPDFTKVCLESKTNVDFRFHSIEPTSKENTHPDTNHNTDIWDMTSDVVKWDKVSRKAGVGGGTWGSDSDKDGDADLFPTNAYGNYMVFRDQWLKLNGCDEAFTNVAHYEDMDFCARARNAGMKCSRRAHRLYRIHHWYGNHSGRANIPTDHAFKQNCPECEAACNVLEPKRFDIKARKDKGEIDVLSDHGVWVCKTCNLCGPVYHTGCHEHTERIGRLKLTRSNVITKYLIGRRLDILTADMDGKSLSEKVELYTASWGNPRYYQP